MENTCLSLKMLLHLKELLENKYGLSVSLLRGGIEDAHLIGERDKHIKELSETDTLKNVKLNFSIIEYQDVQNILDGNKVETVETLNKTKMEDYVEEDEEYDEDDYNLNAISVSVVAYIRQDGVYFDATFHRPIETGQYFCNRIYPELRESIDRYVDDVNTIRFVTPKISDNGMFYIQMRNEFMPQCNNAESYESFLDDFVADENGFPLCFYCMYEGLHSLVLSIENLYHEPWLPEAAIELPYETKTEVNSLREKYAEAFSIMNECLLDEGKDSNKLFFMLVDSVEYKAGRRIVIQGKISGGNIEKGDLIVGNNDFYSMHTVTKIMKDGEAVDKAKAGDHVSITLLFVTVDEDSYYDYLWNVRLCVGDFICSCETNVKFDHKKLADMMAVKNYNVQKGFKQGTVVSPKLIRKHLQDGGVNGLIEFIADCIKDKQ